MKARTHTLKRTRSGEFKEAPLFLDSQCYSPEQIAEIAGISVRSVYNRRHRLLRSIFAPKRIPKYLPGAWVKWMLRNTTVPEGDELKRMKAVAAA
jgi:hypothetical protein